MKKATLILIAVLSFPVLHAQDTGYPDYEFIPFGSMGQLKMTYDARQRPNCLLVDHTLFIVFNAGAAPGSTGNSRTSPMAVTYNLDKQEFSGIVTLGGGSRDHHDGPVIWIDMQKKLHVFYGWHNDQGKHLVSDEPLSIGSGLADWSEAPVPSNSMAYPWTRRIYDNKQVVFYRTSGHYSSWSYRISDDEGKTWKAPVTDVTDLDMEGGIYTDWSAYTSKALSSDGRYLHVGFIAYDDYKRPRTEEEEASGELDKTRQQNPLYDMRRVSYDYNLYYIKIDLRTQQVTNYKGENIRTPIDYVTANEKCMIWNTEWRGGSIVPAMWLDEDGRVSFLHNISNFEHEDSLDYHYVRLADGEWKTTRITHSNHEWNSGYLYRSSDGVLHALVITGPGYLERLGYMDRHGGGSIEEWISANEGDTWKKLRQLGPDPVQFAGWKFNNIQPVRTPGGKPVDGMLIFYGWKHPDNPEARAFLAIDKKLPGTMIDTAK